MAANYLGMSTVDHASPEHPACHPAPTAVEPTRQPGVENTLFLPITITMVVLRTLGGLATLATLTSALTNTWISCVNNPPIQASTPTTSQAACDVNRVPPYMLQG